MAVKQKQTQKQNVNVNINLGEKKKKRKPKRKSKSTKKPIKIQNEPIKYIPPRIIYAYPESETASLLGLLSNVKIPFQFKEKVETYNLAKEKVAPNPFIKTSTEEDYSVIDNQPLTIKTREEPTFDIGGIPAFETEPEITSSPISTTPENLPSTFEPKQKETEENPAQSVLQYIENLEKTQKKEKEARIKIAKLGATFKAKKTLLAPTTAESKEEAPTQLETKETKKKKSGGRNIELQKASLVGQGFATGGENLPKPTVEPPKKVRAPYGSKSGKIGFDPTQTALTFTTPITTADVAPSSSAGLLGLSIAEQPSAQLLTKQPEYTIEVVGTPVAQPEKKIRTIERRRRGEEEATINPLSFVP